MTTQRIYFQKFDELEAILGQKSPFRETKTERIANRIRTAVVALRNREHRNGASSGETTPAAC